MASESKENIIDIISMQSKKNQYYIKQYCKEIQYQSMLLEELRYCRRIYVEVYESIIENQLKITSLLEKMSVRTIASHCGLRVTTDEEKDKEYSQFMEIWKNKKETLQTLTKNINQFNFKPSQNATYISFEPIHATGNPLGDTQRIMDKHLKLQSLEQRLEESRDTTRYKKDMDAFETKQIAEKFFCI